ncbi:MAG: phage major capsid protein [Clostridia bacterium]|nr:phage major capsid protein [Clostridia bacterium]
MVTITGAENALKTFYLDVAANQLNTGVNPFFTKVKQTTSDVWGKNIVKLVPYGVNGGVGAGSETGTLPTAAGNNYAQFTLTLKNLYGTIELSDKAIRASENNAGAFVNLLNAEMDGLLKASKFNFARMLYGDGTGKVADCVATGSTDKRLLKVTSTKNLVEGMLIDVYQNSGTTPVVSGRRILYIDRSLNTVKFDGTEPDNAIGANHFVTVQGSYNNELTGLGAIFASSGTLYGLNRGANKWMIPYIRTSAGSISVDMIQTAIDYIDEVAGSTVDFITTAYDVRRFYLDYLALSRTNVDYMNLDGGFKAISYNGIPLIADRFMADGTMYILNSGDFKLHQLCDWRWLEGDGGRILMQKAGTPTYTATLVKYADMICDKPIGQAKISGITAASA